MSTAQSVPEPESGLLETGEFYVSTYSYGGNLRKYIGISTEESAPGDYDLITLPLDVTPSNPTVKPPKWRIRKCIVAGIVCYNIIVNDMTVDVSDGHLVAISDQPAGRVRGCICACVPEICGSSDIKHVPGKGKDVYMLAFRFNNAWYRAYLASHGDSNLISVEVPRDAHHISDNQLFYMDPVH